MLNLVGVGTIFRRAISVAIDAITEAVNAFYTTYIARVTTDSGSVRSETNTKTIYRWFVENDLVSYIKFLWFAEAGIKIANPSDTLKRLSKGYSLDSTPNNWTQAVEANQPYLSGDIAPNEVYAAKNVQGVNRTISHSNIAFAQGEEWTYSMIINNEWTTSYVITIASNGTASNRIMLRAGMYLKYFYVQCGTGYAFNTLQTPRLCGKNAIITIVAKSNNMSVYVNDEPVITVNGTNTAFTFNKRFSSTTADAFYGKQYFDLILSKAITPAQKTSLHTLLRTMIPEIETVQIGSQHWATSNYDAVITPMGTEIQEMTLAANTEKITNAADREFSSDTGFWTKGGTATINNGGSGVLNMVGGVGQISRTIYTVGKYYKFTYTVAANRGTSSLKVWDGTAYIALNSTVGTYTIYFKATGTKIYITDDNASCDIDIDDVSLQEVGWAGLGDMYDGLIAQGESAADAQKAVAAWCYHNSDSARGAIYGKIFNQYAIGQLKNDIAAWNAANPTNLWGYSIPTKAQLTALAANGGNALKATGTSYWTTTGGTNTTGFTALGGATRGATDGVFATLQNTAVFGCTTDDTLQVNHDNNTATINETVDKRLGRSLRLIKD